MRVYSAELRRKIFLYVTRLIIFSYDYLEFIQFHHFPLRFFSLSQGATYTILKCICEFTQGCIEAYSFSHAFHHFLLRLSRIYLFFEDIPLQIDTLLKVKITLRWSRVRSFSFTIFSLIVCRIFI